MSWQTTHRKRPDGSTVHPAVESLEDRLTPTTNFRISGGVLFIAAPTQKQFAENTIVISDNGTGGVNNITVFAETEFVPNVAINAVRVVGGAGRERVVYRLLGSLTVSRNIQVTLGEANDSFSMAVGPHSAIAAALNVTVDTGAANDRITFLSLGTIAANGSLNLTARGGAGQDRISANIQGPVAGRLRMNLDGGLGADRIAVNYSGVVTGSIGMNIYGRRGNDNLSAKVNMLAGSTGSMIPSLMLGQQGNDRMNFIVRNAGSGRAFNQLADGGQGIDLIRRTSLVYQLNCELDNLVA
jgi:hypothetical protein